MTITAKNESESSKSVKQSEIPRKGIFKKRFFLLAIVSFVSILSTSAIYITLKAQQKKTVRVPTTNTPSIVKVTALGRLQPRGDVIKLSVANAQDSRVNKLLVSEGDKISAGQMIAVLQGIDKKQAELVETEKNLAIEQAKLAQVKTGQSKVAELAAQNATVARVKAQLINKTAEKKAAVFRARAQLKNARVSYLRYQTLHKQGAISAYDLDKLHEVTETARANLNEAQAQLAATTSTLGSSLKAEQATLDKLKEVRPVDIQLAQANIDKAIASVQRIKTELEDFYVRSPIAGQVLKINTRVGEQVNISQGIVELGQTNQMYAIAEVYETDVDRLRINQHATIESEHGGMEGSVSGTVEQIGLQIKKQDVLESDPAADKDARVIEVKVRIRDEDTVKVSGLTNLQVRVAFDN